MSEQQLRVLLVDDEASFREPLARYLRQNHGYQVETAATGESALARVEGAQGQYDVALIDDQLIPGPEREPELLGIKLLTEIRTRYPHIEFILFTGWGLDSGLEALRAGAYRYLAKPFNLDELAVMIEHAAEYRRLKDVAREKQILERLMETSAALLSEQGLQDVLDIVLRGVQSIGFDRVRLYLLTEDSQAMVGRAQAGMDTEFVGITLQVADDVYIQALLADPRPQVFEREDDMPLLYEQRLAKEEVNQWACVPLLLRGQVIGKLSVDNKFSKRPISEAELGPVALFASQAAAAIENARLMAREQKATQEAAQRARNLQAIQEVSTAISSLLDPDKILGATCRAAVELFSVDHSGLVLFEPDCERGQVVAEYPDLGTRGIEIPVGGVPDEEQLVATKEPLVISDVASQLSLGAVRDVFDRFDIRSILIVPVVVRDQVVGSFSLDAIGQSRTFTEGEIELCKLFATQVAVAIKNARLYESTQRQAERLQVLYEIGREITSALELDQILDSIAGHIVRLVGAKRSLFLLIDTTRRRLIRATGHGYPSEHLQRLTFEEVEAGVSGWVLRTGKPALVIDAQSDPRNTGVALEKAREFDTVPLIVAPLVVKGEVKGTLTAINAANDPPFTKGDLDLVVMLANQAAISIENAQLFEEARGGLACLRSVSQAGSALISTLDPDQVLQVIVEQAQRVVKAWRASVVLIDEGERPTALATAGFKGEQEVATSIRPDGLSIQVMRTNDMCLMEDVAARSEDVNPDMLKAGVGAAACLPLSLRGQNIGVMWIQHREPRSFSETEIEALRIYCKEAALAFDNARRMREMEHMRQAAQVMAGALDLPDVLQRIVESARQVLQADSSAIWSYDNVRNQFIPEELVADGISRDELEKFRKNEPKRGGTASTVMERSWLGVTDVSDPQYEFMGPSTHDLLENIGAKSFEGIALKAGTDNLGVLYVNYNHPRDFTKEDKDTLENFANQAALALKKARLLDQVNRAREAARVVAEVSVLEDLQSTLDSIVKGTQDVLNCDTVTVYTYDQDRDEFGFPPAMVGVRDTGEVLKSGLVVREAVIRRILALDRAHMAEDAASDSLMSGAFVEREEIKSSVGIPLKVGERKVGVMFVKYRSSHRFTADELTNVELFANQAAVAIRNAQLYEQVQKRAGALQALHEAGRAVTGSLDLNEILSRIAEQAWRLSSYHGKQISFANIRLLEEMKAKLAAAYPREVLSQMRATLGKEVDLRTGRDGRIGITGRAIITGKSQLVGDATSDPEYLELYPETRSELAVPVKIGDEVIGAINVEHPDKNAFDEEDQRALESLAAQAAVAIHNAQLYDQLQKRVAALKVLYEAGQAVTSTLALDEILDRIVEQAWRLVEPGVQGDHFSHLAFVDGSKVSFAAAYPQAFLSTLEQSVGDIDLEQADRIGVTGRVVIAGQSQIIGDTSRDPDFIESDPKTKSELAVPIKIGGQIIGVINIEHPDYNAFDEGDRHALESMAAQAAIAIQNARLYQQSDVLRQVAVSLAGTSELQGVLNLVMTEAMKLTDTYEGGILFWDAQTEEFTKALRINSYGILEPYRSTVRTKGLTRKIVDERKSKVVPDTKLDPDPNPAYVAKGYRAEVGVPLLSQGEAIGVLYVRSKEPRQFSDRQVNLLEILASQAAVAIDRARQYEELKRTKGLVGARTALAWMGMANNAWRHSIEGYAINIRNAIGLLRQEMQATPVGPTNQQSVQSKLDLVERLATQILDKPITPPLSSEEGLEVVMVNDLIHERIGQLWENESYQSVTPHLDLKPEANVGIRVSPEWLRRALDLLIDNAVEAMANSPERQLRITTRLAQQRIEIATADTGPGIASEIYPKLFKEPIEPPKDGKGMGMGLLMVQAIVETYSGDISIRDTGPQGTTMVISLPVAK